MTTNGEIIQNYFEDMSQSLLVGISDTPTDKVILNIARYEV